MQQYCNLYFNRLQQLKPVVRESAELKWNQKKARYMDNILDLKTGELTVIIGTLFKEQKLKPCVFSNIEGVISAVSAIDCSTGKKDLVGKFTSENDYAILEDASGRIQIRESSTFKCNQFVTGSIIALLGTADHGGYFVCKDFCYAGVPYKVELPRQINLSTKRGLFDSLENRRFIAFTSGLNFGGLGDSIQSKQSLSLFSKFLQGNYPNELWNLLSTKIQRLVICGDSTRENVDTNNVQRGSFRQAKLNSV